MSGWGLSLGPRPAPALPGRVATPVALRLGPWLPRREVKLLWALSAAVAEGAPAPGLYSPRALPPRRPQECLSPSRAIFGCWALETLPRPVRGLGPPPGSPALTIEGAAWPAPRYRGPGRIWSVSGAAGGAGVERGSPPAPVAAPVLPKAAPPRPVHSARAGLRPGRAGGDSHVSPLLRVLTQTPNRPGVYREEEAVSKGVGPGC